MPHLQDCCLNMANFVSSQYFSRAKLKFSKKPGTVKGYDEIFIVIACMNWVLTRHHS